MPVVKIVSQQVKHLPSAGIGKLDIECNCYRWKTIDEIKYLDITDCHNRFESFLSRLLGQYFSEAQIIFDDENNIVVWLNIVPVIAGIIDHLADDVHILRLDAVIGDANRV